MDTNRLCEVKGIIVIEPRESCPRNHKEIPTLAFRSKYRIVTRIPIGVGV